MKTKNLFNKALPFLFVAGCVFLSCLVYGIAGYHYVTRDIGIVGCIGVVALAVIFENIDQAEKDFK
jgi:hypothetical protein